MAKAPVAGTVKTRLVPPLTHEQAAGLYRSILWDQLEHLKELTIADLFLAFTPSEAASLMADMAPPNFRRFAQRGDDLGARMKGVFEELIGWEYRNIVLIGGDLPPLPLEFLQKAFEILAASGKRVVLGPSGDGGYYLVGMNQPTPQIFAGMSWSHSQVLAQTVDRLTELEIEPELLPVWFDLDTVEDLAALQSLPDSKTRKAMKRTLEFLRGLKALDRSV